MGKTQVKNEEQMLPSDAASSQPVERRPARSSGGGPLRLHKPGQGSYVRWGTAAGAGILSLGAAQYVSEQLRVVGIEAGSTAGLLIPVAVLVALVIAVYWLVGRQRTSVEFLIATEGEMKKVNWSSWREVWGATRVVIVTVLALGLLLALVDFLFMVVFSGIGVLKINPLRMFLPQAG